MSTSESSPTNAQKQRGKRMVIKNIENDDFLRVHFLVKIEEFVENIYSLNSDISVNENLEKYMNYVYLLFGFDKKMLNMINAEETNYTYDAPPENYKYTFLRKKLDKNKYFRLAESFDDPEKFMYASKSGIIEHIVGHHIKYQSNLEIFIDNFIEEWKNTLNDSRLIHSISFRCNDDLTEIFDRDIRHEICCKFYKNFPRKVYPLMRSISVQFISMMCFSLMFFGFLQPITITSLVVWFFSVCIIYGNYISKKYEHTKWAIDRPMWYESFFMVLLELY